LPIAHCPLPIAHCPFAGDFDGEDNLGGFPKRKHTVKTEISLKKRRMLSGDFEKKNRILNKESC
jgi:hypothetical protein